MLSHPQPSAQATQRPPSPQLHPLQSPPGLSCEVAALQSPAPQCDLDEILEELRELEEGGSRPDFEEKLAELNARIDAVPTVCDAAAPREDDAAAHASPTEDDAELRQLRRAPVPIRPRAIARLRPRPACFDEPEALLGEQLNLEEGWRESFTAFQQASRSAATSPSSDSVEQLPHTDLSSERLEDMLDLADCAHVVWPPGLDARLARRILSGRKLPSR